MALGNKQAKLTKYGEEKIQRKLKEIGVAIESEAKRNLTDDGAVDTGRLRSSITHKVTSAGTVIVGTPVKYAPYIEFGTSPHFPPPSAIKDWVRRVISPDESVLDDIAFVIARSISRTGTPARPFLRPAIDKVRNSL